MIPMKQDADDVEVQQRLWRSTEKELMHFAKRYAEEYKRNDWRAPSEGQNNVAEAAKMRGYPKTVVRMLGDFVRTKNKKLIARTMSRYRARLKL